MARPGRSAGATHAASLVSWRSPWGTPHRARAREQHRELLADLAARRADHMTRIGEQPGECGDDHLHAGFFDRLPDGGVDGGLTDVDAAPRKFPGPLSHRRTRSRRPPSHLAATKTDGTARVAVGAEGSRKNTCRVTAGRSIVVMTLPAPKSGCCASTISGPGSAPSSAPGEPGRAGAAIRLPGHPGQQRRGRLWGQGGGPAVRGAPRPGCRRAPLPSAPPDRRRRAGP
jgi:hypothetical protein